jgi:nucleotide-binding universal stress UspA family protein
MVRGTIVVGYDGSDAARRALVRAGELAAPGGEVLVVTAARPPVADAFGDAMDEPSSHGDAATLLAEAEALLRRANDDVVVATLAESGDPADALIRAAEDAAADLIVVGARGRDYVTRTLLGSVTKNLVTHASCDVLVTR